jgi:hypothetical protein
MTKKTKPQKPAIQPSERINKTLKVMEALSRDNGVTIDELVEITGWQKHSARGFLSNIRKKLQESGDMAQIVKFMKVGKITYKLAKTKN